MGRQYRIILNDFYCTQCHQKGISVPRKPGSEREAGHLKKMWCIYCQKETNFCEIQPNAQRYTYQDFLTECEYNNFKEDGTRKYEYSVLKGLINNGKI